MDTQRKQTLARCPGVYVNHRVINNLVQKPLLIIYTSTDSHRPCVIMS